MKKSKLKIVVVVLMLGSVSLLNSCYYDNQEDMHPNAGANPNALCDTTGSITYNGRVKEFMITYCGANNSLCHTTNGESGWDLSTYAGVTDAANNSLLDAMYQINGASPMPKDAGKLNDDCIKVIQKWVDEGKPEN